MLDVAIGYTALFLFSFTQLVDQVAGSVNMCAPIDQPGSRLNIQLHIRTNTVQHKTGSELTLSATTNLLFFSRARYTLPNFPEETINTVKCTHREGSQLPLPSGRPMSKSSKLHRFVLNEFKTNELGIKCRDRGLFSLSGLWLCLSSLSPRG